MEDPNLKELIRRLARQGAETLSTQELLTVLLSTGSKYTASEVVQNVSDVFNNFRELYSAAINDLTAVQGIGFVKACKIKALLELGRRIISYNKEDCPVITSTEDAVTLVAPSMMFPNQEQFRVILLDSKKRLIRPCIVSIGSLNAADVHPGDVFRPAITYGAASLILIHNHPSGDPTPSDQDILLTQQLCMCGVILGITVLDHAIIGVEGYVCLKEQKLM